MIDYNDTKFKEVYVWVLGSVFCTDEFISFKYKLRK